MPIVIDGKTYYRTAEVCRSVGISRSTFFRWLKQGAFSESSMVDRRGWRLFSEPELKRLKAEANRLRPNNTRSG